MISQVYKRIQKIKSARRRKKQKNNKKLIKQETKSSQKKLNLKEVLITLEENIPRQERIDKLNLIIRKVKFCTERSSKIRVKWGPCIE